MVSILAWSAQRPSLGGVECDTPCARPRWAPPFFMATTAEQLNWIRAHGITRCPPAPIFPMPWHRRRDWRSTEGEHLIDMRLSDGCIAWFGEDLSKRRKGRRDVQKFGERERGPDAKARRGGRIRRAPKPGRPPNPHAFPQRVVRPCKWNGQASSKDSLQPWTTAISAGAFIARVGA